jgi:hypothetical protein
MTCWLMDGDIQPMAHIHDFSCSFCAWPKPIEHRQAVAAELSACRVTLGRFVRRTEIGGSNGLADLKRHRDRQRAALSSTKRHQWRDQPTIAGRRNRTRGNAAAAERERTLPAVRCAAAVE